MARSLGSLVVSLGLNSAEFTSGLTKAERDAQRFARGMSNQIAAGVLKAEIAFKALGEAASLAIRAFPELINQAGHFQDLAEKTGASAESLASFSIAAQVAGTSVDDLATFSVKLSKNLVSVDEESSKTALGLRALGISAEEFRKLDPAAQIDALAKALKRFNDIGGGKAAALENIAKGGATLLPFMKELEESGGRQVTLTKEQIRQADQFADATARSKAQLNALAQFAAVEAAGSIAAMTAAAKEFVRELLAIDSSGKSLRDDGSIKSWAESTAAALADVVDVIDVIVRGFRIAGLVIGTSAAQIKLVASGQLAAAADIQDDASKRIDDIIAKQQFSAKLEQQFAAQRADAANRAKEDRGFDPRPSLKVTNVTKDGGEKAAALAKKVLEGQLKDLDNFIQSERDLLQDRERFLSIYYQDDQLGLREFFAGRQAALAEATAKQEGAFDEQIAKITAFINARNAELAKAAPEKRSQIESQRVVAETQLADVIAKRARLQQDVSGKTIELTLQEDRAVQDLTDSIEKASIALAEMRGDTVTAAAAGFDFASRKIQAQLNELRKSPLAKDQNLVAIGDRDQADLRKLTILREQLNKATKDYGLTLSELAIAQGRIGIEEDLHIISATEANEKRAASIFKVVDALKVEAAAMQAVATASGKREDAVAAAQKQLEIERLTADAILAQGKALQDVKNMISDTFADAFTDFITGAKSAKDAFKQFTDSLVQQISRIAAQNIANAVFGGKNTAGPDFFAVLAKLLGGLGGGSAATPAITDFSDFFAMGGVSSGGLAVVGEHGRELVDLPRGARVTPNHKLGQIGGGNVTNHWNVNVLPGANTATARQAAKEISRRVQSQSVRG